MWNIHFSPFLPLKAWKSVKLGKCHFRAFKRILALWREEIVRNFSIELVSVTYGIYIHMIQQNFCWRRIWFPYKKYFVQMIMRHGPHVAMNVRTDISSMNLMFDWYHTTSQRKLFFSSIITSKSRVIYITSKTKFWCECGIAYRVGGGKMGTVGKIGRFSIFTSSPYPKVQFKCPSYEHMNPFSPHPPQYLYIQKLMIQPYLYELLIHLYFAV